MEEIAIGCRTQLNITVHFRILENILSFCLKAIISIIGPYILFLNGRSRISITALQYQGWCQNSFNVFHENSNVELLEIFTTNCVESISADLERWNNFKLSIEKFITAFKKIINCQKPLAEQVKSASACHSNI